MVLDIVHHEPDYRPTGAITDRGFAEDGEGGARREGRDGPAVQRAPEPAQDSRGGEGKTSGVKPT